jgi:hypothetical protein
VLEGQPARTPVGTAVAGADDRKTLMLESGDPW